MYKVTRVDTLIDNKVIQEIKIHIDETPIIINDILYIMNKEEYKKYKNGTLETFFNTENDYIITEAPYHLEAFEKFIIEII